MYNFITGPLAWVSFLIFFIGLFIRSVFYLKGLDSKLDRVSYRVNTIHGIKEAFRSVLYWVLPFGTSGWRTQPGMALLFFTFHLGVVLPTVFLGAHNMILKERWGFSLFAFPDYLSDIMTIVVLVSAFFLFVRRILFSKVRILTKSSDYLILFVAILPFFTGFIAYHQFLNYPFWMIAHIISGEILLIVIPFTKLSHCFLFFLTRAQLGMDYGIKRGGMKRNNNIW